MCNSWVGGLLDGRLLVSNPLRYRKALAGLGSGLATIEGMLLELYQMEYERNEDVGISVDLPLTQLEAD